MKTALWTVGLMLLVGAILKKGGVYENKVNETE